jgi:hypothetical protein
MSRKRHSLIKIDFDMLLELHDVLEYFIFATDEWQSNKCSIPRVYPRVILLKYKLNENIVKVAKIMIYLKSQLS